MIAKESKFIRIHYFIFFAKFGYYLFQDISRNKDRKYH